MATQLDLQEQEQLDALKAFWNRYGNPITWLLVLVLGGFAAWNGWQWYERDRGAKAGALFDELERAAQAADADRTARIFGDLRERHPASAFAQQGGLLTAKIQFEKGQLDAAKASLQWVAEKGAEEELRTIARLRLSGVQLEARQFDEALKTLDGARAAGFEALVSDRRGDVLMAQGKPAEARAAWQGAWAALEDRQFYKRIVEAKLTSIGAAPAPAPAASAPAAPSASAAGATK